MILKILSGTLLDFMELLSGPNLRLIELALDAKAEGLSTNEYFWKIPKYSGPFSLTGKSARLLSSRGVDLFDAPNHRVDSYHYPLRLFLSAVQSDDYDLIKHLLDLKQDQRIWEAQGSI